MCQPAEISGLTEMRLLLQLALSQRQGSLTLANSSTAITGIVFGFCNIANSAAVTASTTAYFNCTGATGITTSHRVFVQATSSLSADLFVQAASSTDTGTINIQVANLGYLWSKHHDRAN